MWATHARKGRGPSGRLARETPLGSSTEFAVRGRSKPMATHVIFHEVDDVEHWLSSPKREEVFGPMGITVRTSATRRAPIVSA